MTHTPPATAAPAPRLALSAQPPVWRVLLAVGLGTALSLMGDTALYAVLPTHTAAAGVSLASVGILLSANRWIRLGLNGPAGWAYDRWPRRRLFVPALFLGALSTAMYALTTGFWPLLAARLLWGLAWSGIWVGGNTIMLDVSHAANRGRLTGLYQLAFFMGGAVGFPIGGLLTDWLGFHAALGVAAGVTLLGAVLALLLLPETRQWRAEQPHPAPAAPAAATAAQPDPGGLAAATLLYSTNRFVVAGLFTATLALLIEQRWEEWALPAVGVASLTGILLGLSTLTSMLAAPVAGHWSDQPRGRWRVAALGLLPGVVGLGLLAVGSPWAVLLAVPLLALTSGSNQSVATALLGDLAAEQRRGRALGLMHTFGDLGSALAPPLAYFFLAWLGLPGLYLAGAALLAGLLGALLQRARAAPSQQPQSSLQ